MIFYIFYFIIYYKQNLVATAATARPAVLAAMTAFVTTGMTTTFLGGVGESSSVHLDDCML
jgi:hypothetical protein